MADLTATVPDAQLAALDTYLASLKGTSANSSDGDRITAINAWVQEIVNAELWQMANNNAMAAVSDPTV
mgnify:CR=1 FL=1